MASITRKRLKGITYYYAEERMWQDGKSKRKWQKYLGPVERIIKAVEGETGNPEYAVIFDFGGPASYMKIAEEIKVVETIDSLTPKKKQGLSIGEYILFAVINRGLKAVSKRSMWNWFKDTILVTLFPAVNKESLSSQRFWDNMNLIKEEKIPQIWLTLINYVINKYAIDLSKITYDGTNFYTFISTFNIRCSIAQRGKNKQGRKNLRQVNYALFCSKVDSIPLFFDVYEGNTHDSKEFFKLFDKFKDAFKDKIATGANITIIFDKGNNSLENIKKIDNSDFHFVGSVKPDEHKELAMISNKDDRLIELEHPELEKVKAYRLKKKIYGKERTVILTFNGNLHNDQIKTINNDIEKCMKKLSLLSQKLRDRADGLIKKGKKPTIESVKQKVKEIRQRQFMKNIIKVDVKEKDSFPLIDYCLDMDEFTKVSDTYLGKNIIITDNHEWKTEDIILAYRSQYIIENVFRETKDRKLGCWWPMFHWTDQKIKVHGLYCSITLLIRSIMSLKVRSLNLKLSMVRMHENLEKIKKIVNFYPKPKGRGIRKKTSSITISKMNEIQKSLYEEFDLKKYFKS